MGVDGGEEHGPPTIQFEGHPALCGLLVGAEGGPDVGLRAAANDAIHRGPVQFDRLLLPAHGPLSVSARGLGELGRTLEDQRIAVQSLGSGEVDAMPIGGEGVLVVRGDGQGVAILLLGHDGLPARADGIAPVKELGPPHRIGAVGVEAAQQHGQALEGNLESLGIW
ncbi:hypothetical protein D3C72_1454410 [compost metagenome]